MVLENSTSGGRIVVNRVTGFDMVYLLVWEEKLLPPQHTHLPSPIPSCLPIGENFMCRKERNTPRSRLLTRSTSIDSNRYCINVGYGKEFWDLE